MKHKIIDIVASILAGLWICSTLLMVFLGVVNTEYTKESEVLNTIFIISQNVFLIITFLALVITTLMILNVKIPKINLKIKKILPSKRK